MKRLLVLLIAIAVALAVTPCSAATIQFAQVFQVDQNPIFTMGFGSSGGNHNTLEVFTLPVKFQFFYPTTGPQEDATLQMQATSYTSAVLLGGVVVYQTSYRGSFTITRTSDSKLLLSGTFGGLPGTDGAILTGNNRGSSVTVSDSVQQGGSANEVIFTSDFLNFAPGSIQSFSFAMGGLSLTLNGSSFVNPFLAGGTGTFSADFIPEPISFLLVGTGLVGVALLRRRRK